MNFMRGLRTIEMEEGRDVVECWEKTIAATAIDEANATVRLYRAGLREWKHD